MDAITAAIVAALPVLATDVVKSGVKDAYEGLKAVIRRKWGNDGPIAKAITGLEADKTSTAQAAVVAEKIAAAKATEDSEVAQALHKLVEEMKAHGVGGDAIAGIQFNMTGGVVQGIAGSKNVTVGTMTFGAPPKEG